MSAAVLRLHRSLKVCYFCPLSLHLSSETLAHLLSVYHQSMKYAYFSSSSSYNVGSKFDFLCQFSPFTSSSSSGSNAINSNERRMLAVGISKLIKLEERDLLIRLSRGFSPVAIAEIMVSLQERQVAFAFFKYAFRDQSDFLVRCCCVVVHSLVAKDFRQLAQDVLTWTIQGIGEKRSYVLVWREIFSTAVDFYILDALMRSFTNAEMASCALEVLDRMRGVGGRPSLSAICCLIKLLLRFGDYSSVWMLFKDMIFKGPIPSNYVYNMMILGFCRRGCIRIAESLLYVMRKFGCKPDVYTYNILINAYCVRGWTWEAFSWVHLMFESGCTPSFATFCTFINAFCKEGNIAEANKIFTWMQELGVSPNTVLYNSLMDGYVKAREIGMANVLYEEMRSKGVAPDGVTFNILAVGNEKYGKEQDGNRLLRSFSVMGSVQDSSLPDIHIGGLCWAGRLDEAFELLGFMIEKGVCLTVVSFNSLILAYSKAGLEDRAFEVYNIMLKVGFTPSAPTYTSLLLGLSKIGRLQEAKSLIYKMIQNGYPISRAAFTVVLDGYFKKGDMMGAQGLWAEMEMLGMAPDVVAVSSFIQGLSKRGFVEQAYDMYLKMLSKGLVPNNFVYNSLISGFCNCGELDEALKLELEMRNRGLLPDVITFNIIIKGFCKQGRMKSAMATYMEMLRCGWTPDNVTYNTLISGYCMQLDMLNAENLANTMHNSGWGPDITTYNIQIHGYCRSRRMNRAIMMLDELVSAGIVPDTVTYNTLLSGVCRDILDHAMILTGKLLKMGFVPDLVTTNLLLSNLRKHGLPHRTAMWAQKLSEISFEFDEITHKILDRAYNDLEDVESTKEITGKSLFLDLLMYMTYDFIYRNKVIQKTSSKPIGFTDNQSSVNVEAVC
ncbi:beta-amylase [Salvia divinorum]|uniref:Beta-amylase n=1 Tax=Salvia divinorum TaxID=28513 RepID=A0ABD1FVF0_SALDI